MSIGDLRSADTEQENMAISLYYVGVGRMGRDGVVGEVGNDEMRYGNRSPRDLHMETSEDRRTER